MRIKKNCQEGSFKTRVGPSSDLGGGGGGGGVFWSDKVFENRWGARFSVHPSESVHGL